MRVQYAGSSSEGVTLADGSLTFLPGEPVDVDDDVAAGLIATGEFQAAKASKTKTEEVDG